MDSFRIGVGHFSSRLSEQGPCNQSITKQKKDRQSDCKVTKKFTISSVWSQKAIETVSTIRHHSENTFKAVRGVIQKSVVVLCFSFNFDGKLSDKE